MPSAEAKDEGQVELVPFLSVPSQLVDYQDEAIRAECTEIDIAEDVNHDCNSNSTGNNLAMAYRFLYTSHFIAQWSQVSWQFGLAWLLAAVTNFESVALVTSYAMACNVVVLLGSGRMGRWMDGQVQRYPNRRLWILQCLIGWQSVAVVLATVSCALLLVAGERDNTFAVSSSALLIADVSSGGGGLSSSNSSSSSTAVFAPAPADDSTSNTRNNFGLYWYMVVIALHMLGPLANLLDQAILVAMERDWIVVLSQASAAAATATSGAVSLQEEAKVQATKMAPSQTGNENDTSAGDKRPLHSNDEMARLLSSQYLSSTNVTMRQIDLSCKIAAPAVIGLVISTLDKPELVVCWMLGFGNVVSLGIEYACASRIYQLVPALANNTSQSLAPGEEVHSTTTATAQTNSTRTSNDKPEQTSSVPSTSSTLQELPSSFFRTCRKNGCAVYMQQSCAWAGIALAVVYMNKLSFGNGIMTTYLLHRGLPMKHVGMLHGLAAAIGLLGTVAFHWSIRHVSLETTGLWSVTYQASCLAVTLLSLLVTNHDTLALLLLLGGILCSRIGLWVFDLSVTQLQQQHVPEHVRGQVGGVQQSLNAFFTLAGYMVGLAYPNIENFPLYMAVGFVSVSSAAALFVFGTYLPTRRSR